MPDRDGSILAIEGVEAGYFPDVPILNGVGVSIRPREIVTIVGPNGAGKSTLVKVVIGLLPPWEGSVRLRGEDVTGKKPHAIVARGVGYVAQRDNVFATMSVEENLELGALVLRSGRPGGPPRRDARPVPSSRRASASAGGDALGRRAPDARPRPRADGRPRAAAAGRAVGRVCRPSRST